MTAAVMIVAGCVILTAALFFRAPYGWEDETHGFRYGRPEDEI